MLYLSCNSSGLDPKDPSHPFITIHEIGGSHAQWHVSLCPATQKEVDILCKQLQTAAYELQRDFAIYESMKLNKSMVEVSDVEG